MTSEPTAKAVPVIAIKGTKNDVEAKKRILLSIFELIN